MLVKMRFRIGFALDYPGKLAKLLRGLAPTPSGSSSLPAGPINLAQLTLPSMADEARALGFQHLEVPLDALLMIPGLATEESWEYLNRLGQEGVTYTTHLPFIDVRLSTLNETLRKSSVATVKEALSLCSPLKVDGHVLHIYSDLEEMFLHPLARGARKAAAGLLLGAARKSLSELVEVVEPRRLFLENLEILPSEMVVELAEEFDTKLCLDVGHAALQGQDPISLVESFAPRLGEVHLHDITTRRFSVRVTVQDDHQALGDGWLDLPQLFHTLERVNFQGPVVLELTEERAIKSLDTLRRLGLQSP